ncbi:hypothetical protein CHCC5022_1250 [Bacillus paralicheniformis]|nr:hypothetical protein CHCC5022_1250 [Bacillus paralicheniformis]TWJ85000.1 hypothetical protein CHCC4186_3410 [Bacillus paralicheniformis]
MEFRDHSLGSFLRFSTSYSKLLTRSGFLLVHRKVSGD